jgi:aminoglycoside 3-N-acetyltransferase
MIDDVVGRSAMDRGHPISFPSDEPASAVFAGPKDFLLLAGEWAFRQVYWRSARLRGWIKRAKSKKALVAQVAEKQALIDHLQSIGVNAGSLVMAHTSVSGLSLTSADSVNRQPANSIQVAQELVYMLQGIVGQSGTLVMPTHPVYLPRSASAAATLPPATPVYNPASTPCGVGLANELFWRQKGTLRSLFPHNTLAARGPLASELLRDNLNESKPLPHGIHSGYYRFCQRNGLLISVGVPLASCFTLVHAAEESRDQQWSVKDFFEERDYVVRQQGVDRTVTIRKTRTEFMMFSLCIRKLRRDLVRAGILHESRVGTVRVDWARSGEIYQFISQRNRKSTYPYFGTSLVPRKELSHGNSNH